MAQYHKMSTFDVDSRLNANPHTARILAVAGRKDLSFEQIDDEFAKVQKSIDAIADSILGGGRYTEETDRCSLRFNPLACDAEQDLNKLQQCHEARELLNLTSCDNSDTFYLRLGQVMQGINPSFGGPTMVATLRQQKEAEQTVKERVNVSIDHGVH